MGAFVLSAGVARGSVLLSTPKLLAHVPRQAEAEPREPCLDPPLSRQDMALASGDRNRTHNASPRAQHEGQPPLLGPHCRSGIPQGDPSAAQARLALHPPLRRLVARLGGSVLGRAADGPRLHGRLWAALPPSPRARRPPVAGGADVGGGARLPQWARLPRLAEHGTDVRIDLSRFGGKWGDGRRADPGAAGEGGGARLPQPLAIR